MLPSCTFHLQFDVRFWPVHASRLNWTLHRVDTKTPSKRYRPGLHVHLYLWAALVIVSIFPFLIVSGELFDSDHVTLGLSALLMMVIAFQALLWLARGGGAPPVH